MNLKEYSTQIEEIIASGDLTPEEKNVALSMTASEIDGCLWQPHAKPIARKLAAKARLAANEFPDGGLDALDSLAGKGLLRVRK